MKKGFTLVELLAVIVILGVIALITVPIVTRTINSSKTETYEVSVRNYIRAIESSLYTNEMDMDKPVVADGTYQVNSAGNICLNGDCTKILEVPFEGEHPISGNITIENNKVTNISNLNYNKFVVNMNNGDISLVNLTNIKTICKAVDSDKAGSTEIGTEYICKVNSSQIYDFYVLSTEGNNVNLLMSENITDQTYYFADNSNFELDVVTEGFYTIANSKPYVVTLVEDLTSSWENIQNLNNYSYTIDADAVDVFGEFGTVTLTGKARLATFEELVEVCETKVEKNYCVNCDESYKEYYYESCKSWAMGDYWTMTAVHVEGVWAMNTEYNTLDSFKYYQGAWDSINLFYKSGIRPVITVSTSDLS